MIRLTFCLVRLPHLTRAAFQDYWLNRHGPLVRSLAEPLRVRRYEQLHSLPSEVSAALRASRNAPPEFDGVAELWWDSFAELEASLATSEGREANRRLLADERTFIDLEKSPLWWGEVHVLI